MIGIVKKRQCERSNCERSFCKILFLKKIANHDQLVKVALFTKKRIKHGLSGGVAGGGGRL